MADAVRGSPQLKNWSNRDGFEHPNPAVDDQLTMNTAKQGGYSKAATQDVAAMEINFDRLAQGEAHREDPLVPHWVAKSGADDPRHANEVRGLIADTVLGNSQHVSPQMLPMFLDTYNEAIDAVKQGKSW